MFTEQFVAISLFDNTFAKFSDKCKGSTIDTSPPVSSESFPSKFKLQPSPFIEITLIITPLLFANNPRF